jgi:DNA-binding transcriptional LysR family regulator
MDELRGASWGQLRIGVVNNSGLDAFGLPELLAEFSGRFPEARIHIRNGATLALFDWLLQGLVQLAFVTLTDLTEPPASVTLEPFLVADIGAIVPLSHELAVQQQLDIGKLRGERLILFGNAAMIRDRLLAQAGPLASQLDVVHEVGDGRMLCALTSRDLGVGIGPRWCVGPDDHELVFLPLKPSIQMTIAIAWADRYYRPPAVRALLDLAKQRLVTGTSRC